MNKLKKLNKISILILWIFILILNHNQVYAEIISNSVTISSDTTYSDLTIKSWGNLILNGVLTVNWNITIESWWNITHWAAPTTASKLICKWILDIKTWWKIDVSWKWLSTLWKWSSAWSSYWWYWANNSPIPYWDIYNPDNVWSYWNTTSFAWWWLIRIETVNLINNGSILANWVYRHEGRGDYDYQWSGWWINIIVTWELSWNWVYQANWVSRSTQMSSAWWRIAIKYWKTNDINLLKNNSTAFWYDWAWAWTIYLKDLTNLKDELIIKWNNTYNKRTPVSFTSDITNIEVLNQWELLINWVSNINNDILIRANSKIYSNNAINVWWKLIIENNWLLTHDWTASTLFKIKSNSIDIKTWWKIDVSGKWLSTQWKWSSVWSSYWWQGALTNSPAPYWDIYNPIDVWSYWNNTNFAWWWLVRIEAVNLINNWSILANWVYRTEGRWDYDYQWSGWWININVTWELSWNWVYQANWVSRVVRSRMSSGWWRIAIKYWSIDDLNTLKNNTTAYWYDWARAWTIYLKNLTSWTDEIYIKWNNTYSKNTLINISDDIYNISILNKWQIYLWKNTFIKNNLNILEWTSLYTDSLIKVWNKITVENLWLISHNPTSWTNFSFISKDIEIKTWWKIDVSRKGLSTLWRWSNVWSSYWWQWSNNNSPAPYWDVYNPNHVWSYWNNTNFAWWWIIRIETNNLINNWSILANTIYKTEGRGDYDYQWSGWWINITVTWELSWNWVYQANWASRVLRWPKSSWWWRIAIKYWKTNDINLIKNNSTAFWYDWAWAWTIYLKNLTSWKDELYLKWNWVSRTWSTWVWNWFNDYLFDVINIVNWWKLSRYWTQKVYWTSCILWWTPVWTVNPNINCNQTPWFIYYDLNVDLTNFDNSEKKYEFIIKDNPNLWAEFIWSSTWIISWNWTLKVKTKFLKTWKYWFTFNIYNWNNDSSVILSTWNKSINVSK